MDLLLEGEVMSRTPPSPVTYIITYTNIVGYIIDCIIINFQLTLNHY
jgi:hypothetical protein